MFRQISILAIVSLLIIGCGNMKTEIDSEKEITAIKQVIDNSIGWAMNKDIELLYSSLAQDENFFIYHPNSTSTIRGFDAFKDYAESIFMNEAFKATSYEVKDIKVTLSSDGQNAWYSCLLDDYGEWNGQPMAWENARWTGVLEKRNDNWVITQMHFSFPTDAETSQDDTE